MVMPVFNNQILGLKRTSAPSGVPDEDEVHQDFHQALEEIQREHPHLSKGAMQRMAVERCARKMKGDQPADQTKRAPDLLRGFKSMVRNIGKGKTSGDDGFDDAGGGKDDIDDTIGSTVKASNVDPDSKKVLRQRRSVCSFSFRRSMVVDPSDSDEDNLEDSLENIEQSYMSYNSNANRQSPQRRSSRRRSSDDDSKNRKSRRSSDVSLDLSDVEEDKERKELDASEELGASRGESTSSAQKNTWHSESVSKLLPNEIKEALGNFSLGDNQGPSPVKQGRRKSRRRSRAMARSPRADAESSDSDSRRSSVFSSFMSSFMSTEGDFSAWSSMKGRSKD